MNAGNLKMRLLLLMLIAVLSVSIVEAYVRTDYWECTSLGEQSRGDYWGNVPTNSDAYTSTGVCRKTCCMLCVSRYVYYDCWSGDAKTPCQCSSANPYDTTSPEITINSPADGTVFNTKNVFINASTNELVQYLKRKVGAESIRALCSNCMRGSYMLTSLADGIYNLTITASDMSNNKASKSILFTVDTLPPTILSTKPASGGFVRRSNADFSMTYTENNLVNSVFYYKKKGGSSFASQQLQCNSGTSVSCKTTVPLGQFNEGDVIEYYFMIQDATLSDSSEINEVTIDTALAEYPFAVLSPHSNEAYPKTSQPLNVNAFFTAKDISYSIDNGLKFNVICTNCEQVSKSLSLKDGQNKLIVKVTDQGGSEYNQSLSFWIDSKPPKVKKTTPKDKSYSKGEFSVEYDENDLQKVTLHYGFGGADNAVNVPGCTSGKAQKCSINVNMNSFHGKTISYYFELEDKANKVKSKAANTSIDTVKPSMTVFSPTQDTIYTAPNVFFNVTLDEPVILELYDNGAKPKKLCNGCSSYGKNVGLKEGLHNIRLVATDYAGNTAEKSMSFRVDSKVPVISSLNPAAYTKGSFGMKYGEENINYVRFYYKKTTDSSYTEVPIATCPSGTNKACAFSVNMAALGGQRVDYYTTIEDFAGNMASSKVIENALVDVSAPVMTIRNPVNNAYDTSVPFDVSINEVAAKLELIDNGRAALLCSNCNSLVKVRSFTDGQHTIIIRATDYAGNSAEQSKTFNIT